MSLSHGEQRIGGKCGKFTLDSLIDLETGGRGQRAELKRSISSFLVGHVATVVCRSENIVGKWCFLGKTGE